MMYNNKFVVSVKSGGKVLREFGDTVYVPFGSEFTLFLKNLNSRRASVKVSIDGEDVLTGKELLIGPNQVLELERYLKDLNKGNKFKFIERTSKIEQHRGVGAEDGLIRVEFAYEKERPVYNPPLWVHNPPLWYGYKQGGNYNPACGGFINTVNPRQFSYNVTSTGLMRKADPEAVMSYASNTNKNDVGITVPGSESKQKFTEVSGFEVDHSTVIILKLVGEQGQNLVKKAVTVKAKQKCNTCGKVNKITDKFCTECGTSLRIL